ncbi:ACP phosphodiesterase [Marinomonas pollencensis]|uniref:Acyl carrier protein phosphodiesterase n=1 Tax=Marinomonas pollencensis TaxID=491954 RepID=A0A3E0DSK2_9GAMM|nr:ACP phosphodiesterase [Marinomonas pollencensis]REG86529.1 acyl carrier protein phosphodiesterase [Marinomonas pollencensis]
MNYFAHLHIAYETQTSWAGNLLGDFPVVANELPADLYSGWQLHQKVDVMVDEHEASVRFRGMPRLGRRRFAGIVQDIVMDYWLIQNWSQFSLLPLDAFCQQAVEGLLNDVERCPARLQKMIYSLQQNNWLAELGTVEGVENALHSIMRRWRHGAYLQPFLDELPTVIRQGEAVFFALYPDLLNYVDQQTKKAERENLLG